MVHVAFASEVFQLKSVTHLELTFEAPKPLGETNEPLKKKHMSGPWKQVKGQFVSF